MFNYQEALEWVQKAQVSLQVEVEKDIEATRKFMEDAARIQNMDTYVGWQERGFNVLRGQTAHDIAGKKLFHFTQTTGMSI